MISNRADAAGLAFAARDGIATAVVDHRAFADRARPSMPRSRRAIDAYAPDLVVLAGFMRILTPVRRAYAGRLLNIHPSLLPMFPGLHTHRRAHRRRLQGGRRQRPLRDRRP